MADPCLPPPPRGGNLARLLLAVACGSACATGPAGRGATVRAIPFAADAGEAAPYGLRVAAVRSDGRGELWVDVDLGPRAADLGLRIRRRGVVVYAGELGFAAREGPEVAEAGRGPGPTYRFHLPAPPAGRIVLAFHDLAGTAGPLPGTFVAIDVGAGAGAETDRASR